MCPHSKAHVLGRGESSMEESWELLNINVYTFYLYIMREATGNNAQFTDDYIRN